MEAAVLDDFNDSSDFLDDLEMELSDEPAADEPAPEPRARRAPRASRRIFGMTAPQRMIIALMLFMSVCILGSFFLLVTDSIGLPF
ncbi:MAG: hypothetical protein HYZ26_03035 [Chloroflexi bacterium]|nr:hypothetical protein [Chloroflexota bacterium]